MCSQVTLPNFESLEFFEHEGFIYYMLDQFYDKLVIQDLDDYSIPYIKIRGIYQGKDGILVGYQIKVPKSYTLYKSCLLVGKDFTEAQLHSGILGLQVFESNQGVLLNSTKITDFFKLIDKPL